MSGNYFSPTIYSFEEREIGTWVDDKPLYQKTFDKRGLYLADNTWSNNILGTTGIHIVNYEGYFCLGADAEPSISYSYYRSSTEYFTSTIDSSYSDINVRPNMNYGAIYAGLITIWYTKDSDVAGSGSYGSLGVPMEHLSGDVHAVGTDERGKTIYEVTLNQDTFPLLASTGTSRALGLPAELGINGSVDRIWMASPTIIKANEWMTEFPYVHYDVSNDVGGFFELINNNYAFCVRTGDSSSGMTFECLTIRFTKRTE